MATKKKTADVFDIGSLRRASRYFWRTIEREDDTPLRIKVLDLSIAETNAIPLTMKTPLSETLQAIAPYLVEWNFTAVNTQTGETVPVPPPAEAGWEVFELLKQDEAGAIISWLKFPQQMRSAEEKKGSPTSGDTPEP